MDSAQETHDFRSQPITNTLALALDLDAPRGRLRLRLPPGTPGRADAVFEGRRWAAKHYWRDGEDEVVYEFDEPLPAGHVELFIPFAPTR
jgi:hypothetical protein